MFAYWAIVFFGQSLENYLSSASSWAIFFHGANHELILTQKRFFSGDFFTNSSGHPGWGLS
jgi:hypothetical protein